MRNKTSEETEDTENEKWGKGRKGRQSSKKLQPELIPFIMHAKEEMEEKVNAVRKKIRRKRREEQKATLARRSTYSSCTVMHVNGGQEEMEFRRMGNDKGGPKDATRS